MAEYLHRHKDFESLLRVVAGEKKLEPQLVEKDYWIMHCLHGLQAQGFAFELKGGTSLSKGYKIIHRFSEDIDIKILPPDEKNVPIGKNQDSSNQREARREFFDWLAGEIKIDGIEAERDEDFDDKPNYRNAGIRLNYQSHFEALPGLKSGVLLEVGFDETAPNQEFDISSWAYDKGAQAVEAKDNRAKAVKCYTPGKTLVEKLQAISTKYRQYKDKKEVPKNFLRHYYDVFCLLKNPDVLRFIGTPGYVEWKEKRFRKQDEKDLQKNEAFLLTNKEEREFFQNEFLKTSSLYYAGQPKFEEILQRFSAHLKKL